MLWAGRGWEAHLEVRVGWKEHPEVQNVHTKDREGRELLQQIRDGLGGQLGGLKSPPKSPGGI